MQTVKADITFGTAVPNGDGRLDLVLTDGRMVSLAVQHIPADDPDNNTGVPLGKPINHLWATWSPKEKLFDAPNLQRARPAGSPLGRLPTRPDRDRPESQAPR